MPSFLENYDVRRDIGAHIFDIRKVQSPSLADPKKSGVFGLRLKAARLKLGLAQDKLGVMIGLDEHTASARISRYEKGVHEPAIKIAQMLALRLGVPLAYLYCENNRLADFILLSGRFTEAQWEALLKFVDALEIPDPEVNL